LLAAITLTIVCITMTGRRVTGDEPVASAPALYGFCVDLPAVPNPPVSEQAGLLKELGFDGVGYPLWFGDELAANLRKLDEAGMPLYVVYTMVRLEPDTPAFDPRLPASLAALKGRPVTVSVLLQGLPPADPAGMPRAVEVLRELSDIAAQADLRISIYHHLNDWTESLLHALQVVKQVDRPNVGVNFNLCHWLKVDGDKDYRAVLKDNADRIFAVTINGAQLGSQDWVNGLIQPLDRGNFDNRQLLSVLREIGYRGPVGLMCYGIPDDTREYLQRSMKTWKSWQE
jgi:sugar phosphate isomerase/epimerase